MPGRHRLTVLDDTEPHPAPPPFPKETPMSSPLVDRPVPLRDAFKSVGSAIAFSGSLLAALVGWGVISASQGDAVSGLLGAIPGVVSLVTALLAAFGVVVRAEPQVTPSADPATVDPFGNLVPLVPQV